MRDHQAFRDAFSVMLADTPVAPAWEELEHHIGATTISPEPRRRRRADNPRPQAPRRHRPRP